MTMATSDDYGHTWKIAGSIITGTDPPHDGKETGDSCANVVRGTDGYDYAYCVHNGGHSWDGGYGFIARAPSSDPGPGKWRKYFNGEWSEPGVGGKSSPFDSENFGKRYHVFRRVNISWSRASGDPQVGEMLAHWYSASEHEHWATTAPVPGNYTK